MKVKLLLLAVVVFAGVYSAFACSYSECGGGSAKCCTDHWGATYYAKPSE